MGKINRGNIKKTIYYLRRNGLVNTWYAIRERFTKGVIPYEFQPPTEQELERQRAAAASGELAFQGTISVVVPAYCTQEPFLRELLDSVLAQSYPNWELILADASEDDCVERVVKTYEDKRVHYVRLGQNLGIAENTNCALEYAAGEYIGLLDHDDMLTPDALYYMADAISKGGKVFFSNEDKCDGYGTKFFEPHYKENFNLDLFLSNNYICHFLVMESSLIKELKLRPEFDGAQDYDLILRAAEKLLDDEEQIVFVPKMLYHWRCHIKSTASNPQSKEYAYEAGRRAVQEFVDRRGWRAKVVHGKHLGFYDLSYPAGPLLDRKDVGAVGGRIIIKGYILGGRLSSEGEPLFAGLMERYSGYLNRAVIAQDAQGVDIRCIRVRPECIPIFEKVTGVPYKEIPGTAVFDATTLSKECDYMKISMDLGNAIIDAGYRVLYMPSLELRYD